MKKTLPLILTFFGISLGMAQGTCATALTVAVGSTTSAPSFNSENGTIPSPLCGLNNPNGTPATKGKWYRFTATTSQSLTVSTVLTQNNNQDTRLIVYSGTCAALVCVGSNDDYNGGNTSQLAFAAVSGTTYYIAFDNRFNNNAFDFTLMVSPPPAADRLSFTSTAVAGIAGIYNNCIADMNGDYKDDIVSAVSTTSLNITYQGATPGTFTTSTIAVANTTVLPTWSIAVGDYDNNGFNDMLFGSGSGVCFLKANATGTGYSTDRKTQSYLVQRTNFVDINNDGLLDGFACDDNAPNRRYINDGTNMNHIQGGIGDFATGGNYSSIWSDFNNDGKIDMHLAKCGQGGSGVGGNINQLFQNNGDGTYTNIAAAANMADPEQTWSSAIGDFNNDGWMDVIVGVNSTSTGTTNLKRNNGDGTFTSVTAGSGFDLVGLGREFLADDFDNDGFLDVLAQGSNIMFGDGAFHFVKNPNTYPVSAVDRPVGDLNNDGFLDIQNGGNVLFNNGNANHYLNVNLRGIQSNRNGIGARIELYGAWGKQIRDVQSGTGFQNMSSLTAHFGLGAETAITQVIIRWPSGVVDVIVNPSSDQSLLAVEGLNPLANVTFNSTEFSLYPVPVRDVLNIKTNGSLVMKTGQVYDAAGRLILTSAIKEGSMNVEMLSSGTYILMLTDVDGKVYSQKFVK